MRLFKSKISDESVAKQTELLTETHKKIVSWNTTIKMSAAAGLGTFMLTMSPHTGTPVALIGVGALIRFMDFDKPIYAGIKKLLETSKVYIKERSEIKPKLDFDKMDIPEDVINKQITNTNQKTILKSSELSNINEMADNMLLFYLKKKKEENKPTIKTPKL